MTITRRTFVAGASVGGLGGLGILGAVGHGTQRASAADSFAICATCGVQRMATHAEVCPICADERQYVPDEGQRWLTPAELAEHHRNTLTEVEPGLTSIRTAPAFGISQHALLVVTPHGNVLWDCLSLVDDATVAEIERAGGLAAIAISHPHFYGAMRSWSRAFGGVPIWIHEGDRAWIPESAGSGAELRLWSGASLPLLGDVALVHIGGHFEGSQVLHWPGGAGGRGAVLAGDLPNICADRRWVTFMRSYPNYIPLAASEAERVVAALSPLAFDRVYGWTPERVLRHDAKGCVERSLARHLRALRGEHGSAPPAPRYIDPR